MSDERDRKLVERYDAHAVTYRELWAPTLRLASLKLFGALAGQRVRRVLDIGTGVGALWSDLRATFPGAWLLGFDRSPGMLKLAPKPFARVVADARALPLGEATIDLALLVFMLFHLDDPSEGIRESRRVVRPGGTVGTVTWGSDLSSPATRIWTECLDELGAAPSDPTAQARHDLLDTPDKMVALFRGGGFDRVETWVEDLVTVIDLEHLVRLRTGMGSDKVRFDSLDDERRLECVASARRRLRMLAPADFEARATIVYAIGQ